MPDDTAASAFARLLQEAAEACVEYRIESDHLFRRWMDAERAAEKAGHRAGLPTVDGVFPGWGEYYTLQRAAREAAHLAREQEANDGDV